MPDETTKDQDIEQLKRQQERIAQEHGHVRWTDAKQQADGSYTVAAPLEGTPVGSQEFADFRENLEREWIAQQVVMDFKNYLIHKLMESAAVSKASQELPHHKWPRVRSKREAELWVELKKAEARISELEQQLNREPKSLWLWDISEIKSAMRQFQTKHPGKLPSEIELAEIRSKP